MQGIAGLSRERASTHAAVILHVTDHPLDGLAPLYPAPTRSRQSLGLASMKHFDADDRSSAVAEVDDPCSILPPTTRCVDDWSCPPLIVCRFVYCTRAKVSRVLAVGRFASGRTRKAVGILGAVQPDPIALGLAAGCRRRRGDARGGLRGVVPIFLPKCQGWAKAAKQKLDESKAREAAEAPHSAPSVAASHTEHRLHFLEFDQAVDRTVKLPASVVSARPPDWRGRS